MKKTRKLIPAIAMLLMSTVMMSTASFAWFSMNKTVTASGMHVNATTSGSLVINKAKSGNSFVALSALKADTSVDFSETSGAHALAPVTYVETTTGDPEVTTGTYKYASNTAEILPTTGLPASNDPADVELTEVSSSASTYYSDYIVYLSAAGEKIDSTALTAQVTVSSSLTLTQKALTVAFTVGAPISTALTTDYAVATVQTECVAAKDIIASGTTNGENKVSTAIALGEHAIPMYNDTASSANLAIPVLIRVYFDGALLESESGTKKTYVRSDEVALGDIGINISFAIA